MTPFLHFRAALLRTVLFGIIVAACSGVCRGQELAVAIDSAQSQANFTVADNIHTVHGRFQLKESKILIEPSTHKIAGNLVIDVKSGSSGSHARDQRMHKEILQSELYPLSTFRAETMEGEFSQSGDSHIKVNGQLNLHGADHPMALDIFLHREGNQITAKTSFGIPYVQWGMKDPSNFLFHMEKTVHMDVEIHGSIN